MSYWRKIKIIFTVPMAIFFMAVFSFILILVSLPSIIKAAVKGHPSDRCWNCGSDRVVTRGFHNSNRRYECKDCGHKVVEDPL